MKQEIRNISDEQTLLISACYNLFSDAKWLLSRSYHKIFSFLLIWNFELLLIWKSYKQIKLPGQDSPYKTLK